MPQILYLSYDGMTDPLGQSQVIPYLAMLSGRGYRFHLVSFEKPENFKQSGNHVASLLKSYQITWHPLTYTRNPPVLSTMYDLWRMKKLALRLSSKEQITLVHCRSYISALAGMWLKRTKGIPFVFDMRGFYADERVDGGLWNLSNPLYRVVYRFFKRKEREMLLDAGAVVCLTHAAKSIIGSWKISGDKPLPLTVIPCCADLNLFNPDSIRESERERIRQLVNITSQQPVVTYLGAIGTWYMLPEMLRYFKELLVKYPEALFLFITPEPYAVIRDAALSQGIPEAAIRVFKATRDEVPQALSLGVASLFFIRPTFSKKASSPTKQGEIMGMGIPVICNRGVGDTDYVIEKYGAGQLIDLDEPGAFSKAVNQFELVIKTPPEQIRAGAEEFYHLEKGVDLYQRIYESMNPDQLL